MDDEFEVNDEIAAAMGFSGFGTQAKNKGKGKGQTSEYYTESSTQGRPTKRTKMDQSEGTKANLTPMSQHRQFPPDGSANTPTRQPSNPKGRSERKSPGSPYIDSGLVPASALPATLPQRPPQPAQIQSYVNREYQGEASFNSRGGQTSIHPQEGSKDYSYPQESQTQPAYAGADDTQQGQLSPRQDTVTQTSDPSPDHLSQQSHRSQPSTYPLHHSKTTPGPYNRPLNASRGKPAREPWTSPSGLIYTVQQINELSSGRLRNDKGDTVFFKPSFVEDVEMVLGRLKEMKEKEDDGNSRRGVGEQGMRGTGGRGGRFGLVYGDVRKEEEGFGS